jgi:hypothetical protein
MRSALRKDLCVEVAGGNARAGTAIQTFDCNETASQIWDKPHVGMVSAYDGRCVTVNGTGRGARVGLAGCSRDNPDQWLNRSSPDGGFSLMAAPDKCLNVPQISSDGFASVYVWDCDQDASQKFILEKGMMLRSKADSSKCLDIHPDDDSLVVRTCAANRETQRWNTAESLDQTQPPTRPRPPVIIDTPGATDRPTE